MDKPKPTQRRGLAAGGVLTRMTSTVSRIPFVPMASREDKLKATSPSTKMAIALNRRRAITYVRPDKATVAARRATSKRARRARAMHRRVARR